MAYHLPQIPAHIRQQVADFIEFLLQKYPIPAEEPLPAGSYRERLMQVSTWREADVEAVYVSAMTAFELHGGATDVREKQDTWLMEKNDLGAVLPMARSVRGLAADRLGRGVLPAIARSASRPSP